MANAIHIIPSQKLDKARWDACIQQSHNGLVYATSTYLDAVASHWDAMIMGDYDYVMPLPWRQKYFIKYVYPPAFTQQLGVFSPKVITAADIDFFIKNIPGYYRYCALNFNYANPVNSNGAGLCKNYLLPLQPGYPLLHKAYSRSAIRNINKAHAEGISVREGVLPADIIKIHRERFKDGIGSSAADYDNFLQLCNTFLQQGKCFTAGAFNSNNVLIAGSVYFVYKNRLTFILNGNTPASLTVGATHLLKDYVIQKFAGQDMLLDFEGSDFESFSRFYEQFGARQIEHYPVLTLNRLPRLLKYLKR